MTDQHSTFDRRATHTFSILLDIGLFIAAVVYGIGGLLQDSNLGIAGAIFAATLVYKNRDVWRRIIDRQPAQTARADTTA